MLELVELGVTHVVPFVIALVLSHGLTWTRYAPATWGWTTLLFLAALVFARVCVVDTIIEGIVHGMRSNRRAHFEALAAWRTDAAKHSTPGAEVAVRTIFAHGLHAAPVQALAYAESGRVVEKSAGSAGRIRTRDAHFWAQALAVPYIMDGGGAENTHAVWAAPWAVWDVGGYEDSKRFADHVRTQPGPLILVGSSRGAATVFNAVTLLAQHADWPRIRAGIRAVVCLCGPFSSVEDVMERRRGVWPWRLLGWLMPLYARIMFNAKHRAGFSPLERVPHWPLDVPLFVVASRADTEVPLPSTQQVVDALTARRVKAEMLVVDTLPHGFVRGSTEEQRAIMAFLWRHVYQPR